MLKSLLAAALALGLAGAAAAETLKVGAYPANPPWEFKKEDGSFEGFEVDLVREVAKRIGAEVEISDLGFQALFAATASGRIDMAISSITITNERLKSQSFSQGYYDSDMALISRKDGPAKGLADMKGKVVGAIAASTGEKWIGENMAKYGFGEAKSYDTQANLLLDVQAGRLDGAVGDILGFEFAFVNMPTLHVVERIRTGDRYGIMMTKDSPLVARVNDAISAMKADGTLAAIYRKHIGSDPDPQSSTVNDMPLPKAE